MTFLLWLGSGFAFAVGVFIGAYLMRWLTRKDTKRDIAYQQHIQNTETLLKRRNHMLEAQNLILTDIFTHLKS